MAKRQRTDDEHDVRDHQCPADTETIDNAAGRERTYRLSAVVRRDQQADLSGAQIELLLNHRCHGHYRHHVQRADHMRQREDR